MPWHKLEKSKKLEFSNLCHGKNPSSSHAIWLLAVNHELGEIGPKCKNLVKTSRFGESQVITIFLNKSSGGKISIEERQDR
jgi:hypothetical protein